MGHHQVDQYSHYQGPRRRRQKGAENLFEEIIAKKFPNLGKKTDTQIQEAQKVPNTMNLKRPMPRCITIKLSKLKKRRDFFIE